jgi:hypothetical protein
MDCLAQAIKDQEIWCMRRPTRDFEKLDSLPFCHFVSSNAICLHDFKLILCMLGICINYSTKFASQFPEVLKEIVTALIYKIVDMQCLMLVMLL